MQNKLTVTLEQRLAFPWLDFGDKIKIKVLDLEKIIIMIRQEREKAGLSNIIQIIPARIHKYHEPNYKPTFTRDPVTSVFYGIPIGIHPDGNIKWMKIPLMEALTLDLNKDQDCKWWAILRMHSRINISPFAVAEDIYYNVVDPEIEAKEQLAFGTLISNTLNKIRTMKREKIRNFARWCDLQLKGDESDNSVRAKLTQIAIANPQLIQDRLNDQNRPIGEIFKSAKQLGLVKHDYEKGYQFKGSWLGLTDFECITFLSNEKVVMDNMLNAVKALDKSVDSSDVKDTEQKVTLPVTEEEDDD